MVRGAYRTNARAKRAYRSPGGETRVHYFKKQPKKAHCAECGAILAGVPAKRPYQIRKLTKSQRRPERIFGGNLCAQCVDKKIKLKVLEYNSTSAQ